MKKELVIEVSVVVDSCNRLEDSDVLVQQVGFHGTFWSIAGSGTILPGGVDTQVKLEDGPMTLSARYMMEGTDEAGNTFLIYVENNATMDAPGDNCTHPQVLTNCEKLKYLETADLMGELEPHGRDEILISIFCLTDR